MKMMGETQGHAAHNGTGFPNGDDRPSLTPKQKLFVDYWFQSGFNATKAAEQAGYQGNRNTLWSVASENLRKPAVLAEINRRWQAHGMTSGEVIANLAKWLRVGLPDIVDQYGQLDMDKVHELGNAVKEVEWVKGQRIKVKFQDQMRAAELLGKGMRMWVDQSNEVKHTGEVVIRFEKPDEYVDGD